MIWYCLTYYLLALLGANLGYHRMLAHRAVRLRPGLAHVCVLLGLPAGTPVRWVGNHRFHHAHSDTPLDPHSPAQRGFWYAHCGWYCGLEFWPLSVLYALAGPQRLLLDAWLRPRSGNEHNRLAGEVAADPFYRWVSRPLPYGLLLLAHYGFAVGLPVYLWGWAGLLLAWGTWTALYNIGDAVNSVAHDATGALNLPWLGVLAAGEGWHAEHHRLPGHAQQGRGAGQWDLTWQVIRLLAAAGLAKVESEHGSA